MALTGKILKINKELGYGFIKVPKLGDVFFSTETQFGNASFESLDIGQSVRISVSETERGQFASALDINQVQQPRSKLPEATG